MTSYYLDWPKRKKDKRKDSGTTPQKKKKKKVPLTEISTAWSFNRGTNNPECPKFQDAVLRCHSDKIRITNLAQHLFETKQRKNSN